MRTFLVWPFVIPRILESLTSFHWQCYLLTVLTVLSFIDCLSILKSSYSWWKETLFFLILFFSTPIPYSTLNCLRIWTIYFFFGKFLIYLGNKHNNNCSFNLHREDYPRPSCRSRKFCRYFGQYFPVQIEKTVIIILVQSNLNPRHVKKEVYVSS